MKAWKLLSVVIVAGILGASIAALTRKTTVTLPTTTTMGALAAERELASLSTATAWLNSPPLTAAGLRGKVVLVDFWTYSCINWLRQLPYVRGWAEKYRDQGLVVIGVHTPEFAFEQNLDEVRRAAGDLRVAYPVAIDNDYAIWRGFSNNYWPAIYLIDARGQIRYRHFGEGNYEQSERVIQELLEEAGGNDLDAGLVAVDPRGIEAQADWASMRTPETYVGHDRTEKLVSPEGVRPDVRGAYTLPARVRLNQWALSGEWTIGRQATVLHQAGGRIVYRFHARDLHLVMGPGSGTGAVRFRVLIDGQPPGSAHGLDVDREGFGTAPHRRLYQLIRQPLPVADRLFEIEFLDPGVEVYAFTFG